MWIPTNALAAIAGLILLGACSTNFKIEAPDPELVKACVEDPTISYEASKAAATNVLFTSAKASSVTLPSTFITNKHIGAGSADVIFIDGENNLQGLSSAMGAPNLAKNMNQLSLMSYISAEIKSSALQGNNLWNDPVHQEIITTYNELIEGTNAPEKKFDAEGLYKYQNASKAFALHGGWLLYAYAAAQQIDGKNSVTDQALLQKFVGGMYVHAYLKAYFRNGKFIQGKWNLGNPFLKAIETLPMDVRQKLEKIIPKDKFEEFNKKLEELVKGEIGKIADAGFVSRGGDALAIPPVTASFDSKQEKKFSVSKIEPDVVGADIVRVTIEALGDSVNGIPAVSEATGVISKTLTETGNQLADAGKITLKGTKPPKVKDVMANVESLSGKAHGGVSSIVASAIRGINVAALNNEAIAKILEATAGTIARKATERIAWCWYASIPAEENTKALSLVGQPTRWNSLSFKLTY